MLKHDINEAFAEGIQRQIAYGIQRAVTDLPLALTQNQASAVVDYLLDCIDWDDPMAAFEEAVEEVA